ITGPPARCPKVPMTGSCKLKAMRAAGGRIGTHGSHPTAASDTRRPAKQGTRNIRRKRRRQARTSSSRRADPKSGHEPVADRRLGQQMLRLRGIVFELAPQMSHVNAHVMLVLDV